jgi:hypothetical protein
MREKQLQIPYSAEVEDAMRYMYESLNEKDRRHCAAIEAKKLGHGGIAYISSVLGISPNTIKAGLEAFEKKLSDWSYSSQRRRTQAQRGLL